MVCAIVLALVWFPTLEAREKHCVMEYREDNAFRLQHVFNTIDSCESIEQLEAIADWAKGVGETMREEMDALCPNSVYGIRMGNYICGAIDGKLEGKKSTFEK